MLINEQIERSLIERIQSLYTAQLGRQPDRITCQSFEDKLAIFLENALTQPERLLFARGHTHLVQQVRHNLHEILKPRVKTLIEEVVQITVLDVIMAAQLDTGHISFIAVLALSQDAATSAEARVKQTDTNNVAP